MKAIVSSGLLIAAVVCGMTEHAIAQVVPDLALLKIGMNLSNQVLRKFI